MMFSHTNEGEKLIKELLPFNQEALLIVKFVIVISPELFKFKYLFEYYKERFTNYLKL